MLRVAATYLGVMMLVCVAFSVMFYITSANALHVATFQHEAPKVAHDAQQLPPLPRSTTLQAQTALLKHRLIVRLGALNAGVLVVGCVLSYFLAQRTLRPMQRAMDLQQHFFFDASHELKTPLAGLHLRGEVALRDPKLTLTKAKAAIASNVEQVVKLECLTLDLLELAKAEHATDALRSVSLAAVAQQAIAQLSDAAQAKSIRLANNVADISVHSDAQQLVRVVVILLDNAIKYSAPGTTVHLKSGRGKKDAALLVCDDGPGIRPADREHIFERFYQGDQSRHREGFGLGLSIAAAIVRQLQGNIRVDSSPHGSTFSVHIPLKK